MKRLEYEQVLNGLAVAQQYVHVAAPNNALKRQIVTSLSSARGHLVSSALDTDELPEYERKWREDWHDRWTPERVAKVRTIVHAALEYIEGVDNLPNIKVLVVSELRAALAALSSQDNIV